MKIVNCLLIIYATVVLNFAETLIIPFGAETRENSVVSAFPFSGNGRSQQIYPNSVFPLISEPGQSFLLEGIAFRLSSIGDFAFGATATFQDVEILVSSRNGPFTLNLNENHGADLQFVYDGPLTLTGNVPPLNNPAAFDLHISFTSPFAYNPDNGDLIVEIRNNGSGILTPGLASANIPGGTFYYEGAFGPGTDGSVGLETMLTYQIVPEPNVIVLFATGALVLAGIASRRAHK